jgi:hypothetical protein
MDSITREALRRVILDYDQCINADALLDDLIRQIEIEGQRCAVR